MKTKVCEVCEIEFMPKRIAQKVCSLPCAFQAAKEKKSLDKAKEALKKLERQKLKEMKEKVKSKSVHLREAQVVFNRYIRLRDANEACISCGRFHQGQWHAGHYKSTGAHPELRFDENNVHKQCSACNNHLSGNIINYRFRLIDKIGIEAVEKLEGPQQAKNYSIEDIIEIKKNYRDKVNAIKKIKKI